jgi:uncharacterized protein DUF4136
MNETWSAEQRASRWSGPLAALMTALALGVTACASGPTVRTDYQAATDFSSYRTFAIRPGRLVPASDQADPKAVELARSSIESALRRELTSKGLTESPSSPDVYVTYVGGAHTKQEWENMGPAVYSDYGFLWGPEVWELGYDDWWVQRDVTQGTLVIDLVDAKTRKTVWRAFAEQEDIQQPVKEKTIEEAVSKSFEDYPPKARM